MFRVSFMVEDRKLSEVLRLLSGKVVNMEPPMPVTLEDAAADYSSGKWVESGKSKPNNGVSHKKNDWVKDFPLPKKGMMFNSNELIKLMEPFGFVPGSVYHVQTTLRKAKRIELVEQRRGLPGGNLYKVI